MSLRGMLNEACPTSPAVCVFERSCSYPICTADGRLRKRWGGGRQRGGKVMGCTENEAERQERNEGAGRRRKKEK